MHARVVHGMSPAGTLRMNRGQDDGEVEFLPAIERLHQPAVPPCMKCGKAP